MTPIILIALITFCHQVAGYTNALCPAVCVCDDEFSENGILKLDCSRVYLSIVLPVNDWPVDTTYMDLSSNNISAIEFELVHDKLKVLDLSHNRINSIVQSAFGGLKALQYLDLRDNKITSFEENAFYGLDNLKSLNISSNQLETFPGMLFYHFINLEELCLADNPLVHIDPIYFSRMANLRWLDLRNTDVYTLPPSIFHKTNKLEFLDISDNEFHEVPTDALRSAKTLKHLRLNENPFEMLGKKSFIQLETLEILEINFMENLQKVGSLTFSNLKNLRVLEMKFNRHLNSIDENAFLGLFNDSRPVLQEVDLEKNQLFSLDGNMFDCAKMKKFNVQKNPWICDCRMKWIKKCHIQRIYFADLRCYLPTHLTSAHVFNLDDDDFQCEYWGSDRMAEELHHDKVVRMISIGIGCALLLSLSFAIAAVFKWRKIKSWYRSQKKGTGSVYYVRARDKPREI